MADVAAPSFKKRVNKASNLRKRPATPQPEASDSSGSDYTDDEAGVRVKRRKTNGVAVTASTQQRGKQDIEKTTNYAADRSTTISANDFATKTSNLYASDVKSEEHEVARERDRDGAEDSEKQKYRGAAAYGNFIQKNENAPARSVGPIKAPTNIRTITTTDFAPDVCKDYKQTGFCGFGDGCKFLHAREDYAQGWKLDRDWEKAGKGGGKTGSAATSSAAGGDDEEKILDNIPFACIICREAYKRPIVTRCGHYFCEKCAMQRYMREKKRACAACGADTGGTFNVARKLNELLERKKKREAELVDKVGDGDSKT